jgi:hypothetical protein
MARNPGTDKNGSGFSEFTIRLVWNKGQIVDGVDPAYMRKDNCGAWIVRSEYGITKENGTGWEIDHLIPVAKGGNDDLSNLQPLQWQNNRKKSDDFPAINYCEITSVCINKVIK